MPVIRITKRFTFEMAHALLGYDGLCKNIHGHSYVLWVTLIGEPLTDATGPKNGMVMDFSVLSSIIKKNITEVYDHALLLNENTEKETQSTYKKHFEKVIFTPFQPTCENLIADFATRLKMLLPEHITLHSLKLQETETAYAEWYAGDNGGST